MTKKLPGKSSAALPIQAAAVKERAAQIRMLVLDVDGTLTDGRLYMGPHGEAMKAFCIKDGQGLALLKRVGLKLAIVTGRQSEIVDRRAAELQFDAVLQGVKSKALAMQQLARQFALEPAQMAMMGDDWPDLEAFALVGLKAAPQNAHREVRQRADWVAQRRAGDGAVRELCDYLLQVQGHYQRLLNRYAVRPEAKT
jgi:3-deoxy-D-manno-octulosonate 8-phosphate phosphatase (KDO 8-P phosphatase)